MASKYYAVRVGRTPGIYTDWKTTEALVRGFPGAMYKSFPTRDAAEAWLTPVPTPAPSQPLTSPPPGFALVYTDGSAKDDIAGYGVVILTDTDRYQIYGRVPIVPGTNNVAELYAIGVALQSILGDAIVYTDSKYAIGCLTIWIDKWQRTGFAGIANRELIEGIIPLLSGRTVDMRHVPGHAGFALNEEVDRLAAMGREQSLPLVVYKNGTKQ